MSRLPIIGGDYDAWGIVLNDFLSVAHNADGTQKPSSVVGAAFDGVTDDSAAIQAAIDAASQYAAVNGNTGRGGIVQLPGVPIKVDSTLRIKDGVWLRGAGPATALTGAADPVISLPTGTGGDIVPDNITISDIGITPVGVGVNLDISGMGGGSRLGWPRIVLLNVLVVDSGGNAFEDILSSVIELRYINCVSVRSGGHGFWVGNTDNFLIGCTAAESTLSGFILGGGNHKLVGCKGYGSDDAGFELTGAGRHMLSCCEAQDNNVGFLVRSHTNTLTGCLADTNLKAGFEITGDRNTVAGAVVQYGGGGTGVTTRTGVLFTAEFGTVPTANRVDATVNAIAPVGGLTLGNDISISAATSAGHIEVPYVATITPDPYAGSVQLIRLTGNVSIANPSHKHAGQCLSFEFVQDGVGGRVVTFDSMFRTAWTPDTAADKLNVITFEYDGQRWQQTSAATGLTAFSASRADTFNRADGAIGTSSSGHVWTTSMAVGGSFTVSSNVAKTSGASNSDYNFAVLDAGTGVSDYTVQADFPNKTGDNGLVWRYVDRDNCMLFRGNEVKQRVAGVDSSLGVPTWVAGQTLKVVVAGPSISIYADGSLIWAGSSYANFTGTKAGLHTFDDSQTFDNFSIT